LYQHPIVQGLLPSQTPVFSCRFTTEAFVRMFVASYSHATFAYREARMDPKNVKFLTLRCNAMPSSVPCVQKCCTAFFALLLLHSPSIQPSSSLFFSINKNKVSFACNEVKYSSYIDENSWNA